MRGQGVFRTGLFALIAVLIAGCGLPGLDRAGPLPASEGVLTGKLLVAAPQMPDHRFARTVILVVRHTKKGAMGLVINRAAGRGPIADILRRVGIDYRSARGDIDVNYGGPIRPDRAYILHSPDYADKATVRITPRMSLSGTRKIMRTLGGGNGPRRALFILGHAGWRAGQIDAEIARKYWIVVPAAEELVFGASDGSKWRRALMRRGRDL